MNCPDASIGVSGVTLRTNRNFVARPALNRRPLTVRRWIDAYLKTGIEGLKRAYSPGRPSFRGSHLKPCLENISNCLPVTMAGEKIFVLRK